MEQTTVEVAGETLRVPVELATGILAALHEVDRKRTLLRALVETQAPDAQIDRAYEAYVAEVRVLCERANGAQQDIWFEVQEVGPSWRHRIALAVRATLERVREGWWRRRAAAAVSAIRCTLCRLYRR